MAALLSQALAPVFQAFGARGQCSKERAAPSKSTQGLPEIDYPVPLVVKNTFIDTGIGCPLSLEGFYLEREIHSTPVSAIEGATVVAEVSFEPAFAAKERLGRSAEPDGSSSCRSTSAGSSSARSGADESPGSQPEASPRDAAEPCSPADETLEGASRGKRFAGLPDFEYPAEFFVKNTFIDTDLGRPLSIDGFFEERQLRSCPSSALYAPPDAVMTEEATEDFQELENNDCFFASSTPECTPMLPHCQPRGLPFSIPLPPVEPPALLAAWAPAEPPAPPAPASEPAAPVLRLSDALRAADPGALALPSVGSSEHCLGTCKPCAHAHSAKGCRNGAQCAFCHLCPPGELKRQQKAKRIAQRRADSA